MKENIFYESPDLIVRLVKLSNTILTGSEYGDAGKAGAKPTELDELEF